MKNRRVYLYLFLAAIILIGYEQVSPISQAQVTAVAGTQNWHQINGWFDGQCWLIKNPTITPGTPVLLTRLGDQYAFEHGTVKRKVTDEDSCPDSPFNNLYKEAKQVGYSYYLLDTDAPTFLMMGTLAEGVDMSQYPFDPCKLSRVYTFSFDKEPVAGPCGE